MLRAVRPATRLALGVRAASSSTSSVPTFNPKDVTPKDAAPGQSPNVPTPWSQSQQPKPEAFNNARFEQTYVPTQPDSLSAMGLVNEQPVVMVQGRRAVCNGGGGPLGHPKIFINLDKPGPKVCGYCGARYEQEHAHH